jgi:biopolymer transport protein ExbB/TolQ
MLMAMLAVLAIGLVGVSVALVRPFNQQVISLLIAGLFGPVVGLVGTVVGFYFGQISGSQKDAKASKP